MISKEEECMNIFSSITQETLSAFHVAGTGKDVNHLLRRIRILSKETTQHKNLLRIEKIKGKKVKRFFKDGYIDIVDEENLLDDINIANEANEDSRVVEVLKYNGLKPKSLIMKIKNKKDQNINEEISIKEGTLDSLIFEMNDQCDESIK